MAPPWPAGGQQVGGGDLARRVERRHISGEAAHDPEPLTPPVRVSVDWQPGPHQRQLGRDPFRARLLQEVDEVLKQPLVGFELEPDTAADPQIVLERLAKRDHAAPPSGHGRASRRSVLRSTLA